MSQSPLPSPAENPAGDARIRPRVVLLTSPGLFGAEIINRLARPDDVQLVGVGLTDRLYKGKGFLAAVSTFHRRTGTRYLWYNALQSTVAWTRLKLSGRPSGLRQAKPDVRLLRDVNAASTIDWLKSLAPDYVASFFFNQVIGSEVRQVALRGCVNLHPSLLPALRGPDPIFRTIERGLCTSGLTIHEVADQIDAGKILHQEACAIPQGETAFSLYLTMVKRGADLLARWLAGRVEPQPPAVSANADTNDYNTFPTPDEVRRFFQAGHRLITLREFHRALAEVE